MSKSHSEAKSSTKTKCHFFLIIMKNSAKLLQQETPTSKNSAHNTPHINNQ